MPQNLNHGYYYCIYYKLVNDKNMGNETWLMFLAQWFGF